MCVDSLCADVCLGARACSQVCEGAESETTLTTVDTPPQALQFDTNNTTDEALEPLAVLTCTLLEWMRVRVTIRLGDSTHGEMEYKRVGLEETLLELFQIK